MQITVNIEKRHAFMMLGAILILALVIGINAFTVAPGTIPSPGHALNKIQGYFSGDANLQASLAKFCQSDGTNCPTVLNQNLNITGNLTVTGEETIVKRFFQQVKCTSTGYGSCGAGTVIYSESASNSGKCNDKCEAAMNEQKVQNGCWYYYAGNCYCRGGIAGVGSSSSAGGCGPEGFN
jgi:hypothetical protein